MATTAQDPLSPEPGIPDAPDPAGVQEAAAWVAQLLRTLKTCRLYDEANPTVVRFREDLASALTALLSRYGTLRIEVGSSTLSWAGQMLHAARSRDENLAGIVHRDGIRMLALEPGIEAREVNALLDQILQVTGPDGGDDDLVTLLWDADLRHVTVETVPIEGDTDGSAEDKEENSPPLAWPRQEAGVPPAPEPGAAPAADAFRSDDCVTGDSASGLDAAFDQLETVALFEIARFQQEQEASGREDLVPGALLFLDDCLASDLTAEDRSELAAFIPRVLREALVTGNWPGASACLRHVRACDPHWSGDEFARGLCGPFAVTTAKVVAVLDQQEAAGVESFLDFARAFGAPLAEWLMHALAESQQMRVRRPLARRIAELLADHPDRILPWLSDGRWYVVRNVVHILGWIGGATIPGGLRVAATHPEPRVRREVVAALSSVEPDAARPILINMLGSAEPDLFGTILHQLAADPEVSVARVMLGLLQDKAFHGRSTNERRALFAALASRGESILPELEAELNSGGLMSMRPDPDHKGIALCISRIGTPAAREVLERGRRSRRSAVRKACTIAGATGPADV